MVGLLVATDNDRQWIHAGYWHGVLPQTEQAPMACDTMLQIDGANEVQGVPFHCGYKEIGVKCWRPLESSSWKYHVP